MPDKYVRWLKLALDDMDRLLTWLKEKEDEETATIVAKRIWDGANGLCVLPSRGRPGRVPNTRELQIPKTSHFLVYRVRNDAVEVMRVIHSSRNYPDC